MKEYGGFLPLELDIKKAYYNENNYPIVKVNSGRSALYCALKMAKPDEIYVPHYICRTVYDVIKKMNIPMIQYHINQDMMPASQIPEDAWVIIVNYFGMLDNLVKGFVENHHKVIIDNTQAFFSKPIMKSNIYNIYSCRKFIGVADGGYLISKNINNIDIDLNLAFSTSCYHSSHLFISRELGTNIAYALNKDNESILSTEFAYMSNLTEDILKAANYEKIIQRRLNNWEILQNRFSAVNLLSHITDTTCIGYMYPLLIEKDIRELLIENNIYIPCLWKEIIQDDEYKNTWEYYLSKYLIPLPVDQRYGLDDMKKISNTVLEFMAD